MHDAQNEMEGYLGYNVRSIPTRFNMLPVVYSLAASQQQHAQQQHGQPNFYDFRLQSISCNACYDYDYTGDIPFFSFFGVTILISLEGLCSHQVRP